MQPFDQQSEELLHGQKRTPDLVGSLSSAVIPVARALAVVANSPIRLCNRKLV